VALVPAQHGFSRAGAGHHGVARVCDRLLLAAPSLKPWSRSATKAVIHAAAIDARNRGDRIGALASLQQLGPRSPCKPLWTAASAVASLFALPAIAAPYGRRALARAATTEPHPAHTPPRASRRDRVCSF
jgi:hypothetical protein